MQRRPHAAPSIRGELQGKGPMSPFPIWHSICSISYALKDNMLGPLEVF